MNKYIEEQLKKVKVADLSNFNEETNSYIIKKYEETKYEVDNYYLICLDDSLLDCNANPILISNWNKGNVPKCKYMKIDVSKILGKMIYVNCLGYDFENKRDLDYSWSGWLPTHQVTLVNKL